MLSKLIIDLCGYHIEKDFPDIKKCVIIEAPHTSMWDFVYGKLYFNVQRRKINLLIKDKFFFFPLGALLKYLGGIPVKQRQTSKNFIKSLVDLFNSREEMLLVVTPEGTRKAASRWRSGFYHIAVAANVPILLGKIDYKHKTLGYLGLFYPTGNFDEDIKVIRSQYKSEWAKYPAMFKEIDITTEDSQ